MGTSSQTIKLLCEIERRCEHFKDELYYSGPFLPLIRNHKLSALFSNYSFSIKHYGSVDDYVDTISAMYNVSNRLTEYLDYSYMSEDTEGQLYCTSYLSFSPCVFSRFK